jgi:hypothetical protein
MSSESGGCYGTTAETKSDGCSNSLTCYAYACSSDQSCDNGTCVDNCTPNDCSGYTYCITGTCTSSGQDRIISDSSTYESCTPGCGDNKKRYKCKAGYNTVYFASGQYKCEKKESNKEVTVYYDAPTNCNDAFNLTNTATNAVTSMGAATNYVAEGSYNITPSTSKIKSYTIRMGRYGTPSTKTGTASYTFSAGNEYWIVPNCNEGGSSGGSSGGSNNCGSEEWLAKYRQACHDAGDGQVIGILTSSSHEVSEGSCVALQGGGWCGNKFYYCNMCH